MSYRTIMIQLLDDEGLESRLSLAHRLASMFDAHLRGVHVMAPPMLTLGFGEGAAYGSSDVIRLQREAAEALAERVRARFESFMHGKAVSFDFRLEHGDPADRYAALARTADLMVVPRSVASGIDALVPEICEQLAMSSGVPTLMVPAEAELSEGTAFANRIIVAWSGTRESCRALRDALPLLERAGNVRIVSVGDRKTLDIEALLDGLERRNIRPELHLVEDSASDAGEVIRADVESWNADLLVMGVYGHARWSELVFGGVTRHVLERVSIPVLFSA
ncbi:MAG: universal stress protein [Geminicoccaceae bacterium]